jgi:cell division transport system permease protein
MAWVERLVDLARVGQFLALLVLCFVTGIAVLTVVFATRAGLAIHQETIELLHLLGASDSYLAREFQWQALWLGLRGGIFGVVPAIVAMLLADRAAARLEAPLLPAIDLGVVEWAGFAVLPVISALLAMFTARFTVLRELARVT